MIQALVVLSWPSFAAGGRPTDRMDKLTAAVGCEIGRAESRVSSMDCVLSKIYKGTDAIYVGQMDKDVRVLGSAGTYGEIRPEGVFRLFDELQELSGEPLGPEDIFFDLGSGAGRLVLQAFLATNVRRSVGIEIGKRRHSVAAQARDAALALGFGGTSGPESEAIEVLQGDIFKETERWQAASVMYVSSLAFDNSVLLRLGWAVASLRPGTVLFTLRDFLGCVPNLMRVRQVQAEMSWATAARNDVSVWIAIPPTALVQPSWLTPYKPGEDEMMQALSGAEQDGYLTPGQWGKACERLHLGVSKMRPWRLATLGAHALALPIPQASVGVPRTLVRELVRAAFRGTLDNSAVHCAGDAILMRARERQLIPELPRDGTLDIDAAMARVVDPGISDERGTQLAQIFASQRKEPIAVLALAPLLARLAGADPPDVVSVEQSLWSAIKVFGHIEVTKMLLEHRVSPNMVFQEAKGYRALHYAAIYGHAPIAQLLVEHRSNVAAVDTDGYTALQLIRAGKSADKLRELLSSAGTEVEL